MYAGLFDTAFTVAIAPMASTKRSVTMTRAEAVGRCAELQAGAGDPAVRWMPRQTSAGEWAVVRMRAAGLPPRATALGSAQQAPPRPQAPDPRPLVNPYWGAG